MVSSSTTLDGKLKRCMKNDEFNNMTIGRSETPGNKLVLLVKDVICRFKDDEDLLKCISEGAVLKLTNILRNVTSLNQTLKPVLQKENMENTTSTLLFKQKMNNMLNDKKETAI